MYVFTLLARPKAGVQAILATRQRQQALPAVAPGVRGNALAGVLCHRHAARGPQRLARRYQVLFGDVRGVNGEPIMLTWTRLDTLPAQPDALLQAQVEVRDLKAAVARMRTVLEQLQAEKHGAVQQAVADASLEIAQLKETIVALRGQIEARSGG